VCVRACVLTSWKLLCGEVASKSRGMIAKSNNGLVSVTCCSGINKPCFNAYSYIAPPSNSFLCPYCMILRVLVFHLPDKIDACYVRYAWCKLRQDYYYLYIGDVLCALMILPYRTVLHRLCCTNYI